MVCRGWLERSADALVSFRVPSSKFQVPSSKFAVRGSMFAVQCSLFPPRSSGRESASARPTTPTPTRSGRFAIVDGCLQSLTVVCDGLANHRQRRAAPSTTANHCKLFQHRKHRVGVRVGVDGLANHGKRRVSALNHRKPLQTARSALKEPCTPPHRSTGFGPPRRRRRCGRRSSSR